MGAGLCPLPTTRLLMDILLNTLYTTSYVGSLFVLPSARTGGNRIDPATGRPLTRDSPYVLRARLVGVGLSSLTSLAIVAGVVWQYREPSRATEWVPRVVRSYLKDYSPFSSALPSAITWKDLLGVLGLWKSNLTAVQALSLVTLPLAWTASLFTGPLYTAALDRRLPCMSNWSWKWDIQANFQDLRGWRNYIIGPVTEELVFRSCIIATAATLAPRSKAYLIFVTPLYFGIAHAHHAYEAYNNGGRTRRALQNGILVSLFQFLYTSLFGFHAAFLHLRTGSVLPPILAHIFCNIMGFPDVVGAIQRYPRRKYPIIAAYILGIAGYAVGTWRLTDPALYGGSVFW